MEDIITVNGVNYEGKVIHIIYDFHICMYYLINHLRSDSIVAETNPFVSR
jgi:hypothetical protein